MMRSTAALAAAAGVLTAGGLVAPVSTAVTTTGHHRDTLTFTGVVTDYTAVPSRSSGEQRPGDHAFWVTVLSRDGKVVGRAPHSCVAVTASDSLCTAVTELPGGDLSTEVLLTATGGTTHHGAVTGGTQRFSGASGQLTIRIRPDGSQRWAFHLGEGR